MIINLTYTILYKLLKKLQKKICSSYTKIISVNIKKNQIQNEIFY